jgi:hypothetical protein
MTEEGRKRNKRAEDGLKKQVTREQIIRTNERKDGGGEG